MFYTQPQPQPAQLDLFEFSAAQLVTNDQPQPATIAAVIALTADDFSPMVADAAPYYSIRYPDFVRRSKGYPEASFFIVYRRSDDATVLESSTYDDFETVNRAADDVTADFIENGEA